MDLLVIRVMSLLESWELMDMQLLNTLLLVKLFTLSLLLYIFSFIW